MEKILKFSGEFAGWQVISNEKLIKLEKIPVHAKPYMGITDFKEKEDYYFLCALLIFLEDLEDNESFLLSEMIEQIEIILGEEFVKNNMNKGFLIIDNKKIKLNSKYIQIYSNIMCKTLKILRYRYCNIQIETIYLFIMEK